MLTSDGTGAVRICRCLVSVTYPWHLLVSCSSKPLPHRPHVRDAVSARRPDAARLQKASAELASAGLGVSSLGRHGPSSVSHRPGSRVRRCASVAHSNDFVGCVEKCALVPVGSMCRGRLFCAGAGSPSCGRWVATSARGPLPNVADCTPRPTVPPLGHCSDDRAATRTTGSRLSPGPHARIWALTLTRQLDLRRTSIMIQRGAGCAMCCRTSHVQDSARGCLSSGLSAAALTPR